MKIWVFAAFLVLWGNFLHPLIGSSAVLPGGSRQFALAGAVLIGVSVIPARIIGLSRACLGLTGAGPPRGAATCPPARRGTPATWGGGPPGSPWPRGPPRRHA